MPKQAARAAPEMTARRRSPPTRKGRARTAVATPKAGPPPGPETPPLTFGAELVERLADLVVERVIAKLSLPPLHGGGQGFESPQLHNFFQKCSNDVAEVSGLLAQSS